ncbi:MAG TPA: Ig-like domain-containing protein [Mycobacteriales bacterium]|nr:Ig-like domain-containing protein [Mycobacteriales bacterium]
MGAQAKTRGSGAARWGVGLAVVLAAVAGCTSSGSGSSGSGAAPSQGGSTSQNGSSQAQAEPATVSVLPAADAAAVAPGDPVKVTAQGGTLTTVTVSGTGGAVKGTLDAAKTTWTSAAKLGFGARYTVTAEATNATGQTTTKTSAFTTAKATKTVFPAVSPLRDTTVGVGMPIRVYFDNPVTDRKTALARMKVTTSVPTVGGWHWFSNTEVHWRPKTYWKSGTKVALDTDLRGVSLGAGTYGSENADRHIEFTIGASHVSVADAKTHRMKVYVNGKLTKNFPASLGKEVTGRYTHTGVHIVTDKKRAMTMDSSTFGLALDAGGYKTPVQFATRISNSGEFVHAAPWSVAQQGSSNVSHGCVNLSPASAAWFFGISQPGDVVQITGTPVPLTSRDTDVPDWTIPWSQWGE